MATTVSKGLLKAKMLEYFRRIEETGEELIVTHNSVPVLKISRLEPTRRSVEDVFGDVRGKVEIIGDLLEPTTDEWEEI